eukprot:3266742-Rhodomonas_salina.1
MASQRRVASGGQRRLPRSLLGPARAPTDSRAPTRRAGCCCAAWNSSPPLTRPRCSACRTKGVLS